MKLITLFGIRGKGKFAMVDDEDYERLSTIRWTLSSENNHGKKRNTLYAIGANKTTKDRKFVSMHRLVMEAKKGQIVDHIDGDGFNNQKSNLRFSTHGQNQSNRKSTRGSSSVYLGVYRYHNKISEIIRWKAVIQKDKKPHHSRCYPFTKEGEKLAAKWYNEMARKLHGNFAKLNIIK